MPSQFLFPTLSERLALGIAERGLGQGASLTHQTGEKILSGVWVAEGLLALRQGSAVHTLLWLETPLRRGVSLLSGV